MEAVMTRREKYVKIISNWSNDQINDAVGYFGKDKLCYLTDDALENLARGLVHNDWLREQMNKCNRALLAKRA
jgi:hypothetical protein